MTEIIIQKATIADASSIEKLETMCFNHSWTKKDIEESFQNSTVFFVAKTNGEVIGYLGMQITLDGGFITNVAVNTNFRRIGVGSKLINALCSFCKSENISSISLEVRESNTPAINLYKKEGFEKVGTRKNFYRDPKENANILTKQV